MIRNGCWAVTQTDELSNIIPQSLSTLTHIFSNPQENIYYGDGFMLETNISLVMPKGDILVGFDGPRAFILNLTEINKDGLLDLIRTHSSKDCQWIFFEKTFLNPGLVCKVFQCKDLNIKLSKNYE